MPGGNGAGVGGSGGEGPGAGGFTAVRVGGPDPDDGYADPGRSYYVRLLRLRHVEPVGWQRILVAEGSVLVGVLVALADLASVWVVLVLPLAVAAMVVLHDRVQGLLGARGPAAGPGTDADQVPADRRA